MYDCKAPLSRFYYPDTRRIINAFIIIIITTCNVLSQTCPIRTSTGGALLLLVTSCLRLVPSGQVQVGHFNYL